MLPAWVVTVRAAMINFSAISRSLRLCATNRKTSTSRCVIPSPPAVGLTILAVTGLRGVVHLPERQNTSRKLQRTVILADHERRCGFWPDPLDDLWILPITKPIKQILDTSTDILDSDTLCEKALPELVVR